MSGSSLPTSPPSLRRYMYLSIAAAILTISLKGLAYYLTGSVGLLSDALESVVNLAAALLALLLLTIAERPPDEEHAPGGRFSPLLRELVSADNGGERSGNIGGHLYGQCNDDRWAGSPGGGASREYVGGGNRVAVKRSLAFGGVSREQYATDLDTDDRGNRSTAAPDSGGGNRIDLNGAAAGAPRAGQSRLFSAPALRAAAGAIATFRQWRRARAPG